MQQRTMESKESGDKKLTFFLAIDNFEKLQRFKTNTDKISHHSTAPTYRTATTLFETVILG